jgi:3-oxoacyl-[acyl-carrier-protein] synthase-1
MTEQIVIVGVGMTTAVGVSAPETAASVRARTTRFTESQLRDRRFNRFTLAELSDDALPALKERLYDVDEVSARELRMLRLASGALRECIAPIQDSMSLGISLALPETTTRRQIDGALFLKHLTFQSGGAIDPRASDASHVGRAGGMVALGQAALTIQQGGAQFMIAGGIDSYRDLYVLGTLDLHDRVQSINFDHFIPGEGAGFVLLASARAAAERRLTPLARLSPVAMGFEPGHLYSEEPYRGDGLASTIGNLFDLGAIEEPVRDVYASMNGESHWAKEWGVTAIRHRALLHPTHVMHHPADCFGDAGAACGPLLVGLAALGIRHRYRQAPALVYCSSDHGQRAATVVAAATH